MSDACKLLEHHRDEAFGAIYGSTASAAVQAALASFLRSHLDIAARRAAEARQRSLERSAAIRTGICKAIGALPVSALDAWGTPGLILRRIEAGPPAYFGLRRVPDVDTVRAALLHELQERKERASILEPAKGPIFGSTLRST